MTRLAVGSFLTIDLPGEGWSSVETAHCTVLLRAEELEANGGKPECAQFAIFVSFRDGHAETLGSVANDLVAKRAPYGCERFDAQLGGMPALGFEYGDGVSTIRSYFAACPSGGLVELSIRSGILESGALKVPITTASEFVLAGLRWSPSWTVWRQDDNGIKAEVSTLVTLAEARALVAEFEATGHKQTYWIEGPHKRT